MLRFYVVMVLVLVFLTGCISSTPYTPPAECTDGASSMILEKYPDPRMLDQGLLLVQMAALKKVEGYGASEALRLLEVLETMVAMGDITYAKLSQEIMKAVNLANNDAGALIFIIGPQMSVMDIPEIIGLCDRVLIAQEFARQRMVISFYAD